MGQGSSPKTACGFVDEMATIFLVQAVVGAENIELRGIRLNLTKGPLGCPDTPMVEELHPFVLDEGFMDKTDKTEKAEKMDKTEKMGKMEKLKKTHTDSLSLAIDHEKNRLFALYSTFSATRLFCHEFGGAKNKSGESRRWMELAVPASFHPCTMVKDALLFSASHMIGNNSSLSSRMMVDLRECTVTEFPFYAPYTIEVDGMTPVDMRIMDGPGKPLNDLKELTFTPSDKMYFSASASGPVLITGQTYTMDLSLGGRIFAADKSGKRMPLPLHGSGEKMHTTLAPQLPTDRMRLGPAKTMEFSVQGGEITGLRVGSKYIVVDHVVSGTNRISEIVHGVRSNLVFLSRTDPGRDHNLDMPHQFASSGTIIGIDNFNGQIYVHTCRKGDRYNLHQLWHVVGEVIELTSSLTTDANAFVFAQHHSVNPFNSKAPHPICLCALFNDGRLFTCTCAGDFSESNRSADAFTGKKGYLRGNWDLYYMRGGGDPIVDDPKVRACVVY